MNKEFTNGSMTLSDLLDRKSLQTLMDIFHKLTGLPMSVMEISGDHLVGVGWQRACTHFHRKNSETCKNCVESDTVLTRGIAPGEFKLYKCRNQLWDVATPIIIEGQHLGNIFMGQFLLEDEDVDEDFFAKQAQRYGFDEQDYLKSISELPRFSREKIELAMQFFSGLAMQISNMGLNQLKLVRALKEKEELLDDLRVKENQLEISRETYRNMFQNAQVGLFRTRISDGKMIESNEQLARMFGYTDRDEFLSVFFTIENYVEPGSRQILLDDLARHHVVHNQEVAFYRKDHSVIWVKLTARIFPENGWIEGVVEDITGQRVIQQQIRESEDWHRNLLQQMNLGMATHKIILDENGRPVDYRFLEINEIYENLTGLTREMTIGKKVTEVLTSVESYWIETFGNVALTGIPVTYENFSQALGRYFRVIAYRQKVGEFTVLVEDISEEKQKEEQLREKDLRWKKYVEFAPYGVFVVDELGHYREVNPAACQITGYTEEELLKMNIKDITVPEYIEQGTEHFLQLFREGYAYTEVQFVHKSGENRWWSVAAVKISDNVFIAFQTDITERINSENMLMNAKEKAEEHSRLKTAFLNNMSHELRTPMNAIMGFCELMSEADEMEKDRYAKIIEKSAKHLLTLIDDVTFLSRLQSEKILLHNSAFLPSALVLDLIEMFSITAANAGLELKTDIAPRLMSQAILADQDKMKQILTIFISNAFKYTSAGWIRIGCQQFGSDIEFFVEDTGMGIPEHEHGLIFQNFYRGEDAIAKAIRGTGLGLNIARELALLLKGQIGVDSEVGKGSRFYISIPLLKSEIAEPKTAVGPASGKKWSNSRILLVDDEYDNILMLQIFLRGKVALADHAENGAVAIRMLMEHSYDLVLMDLKMPVMDGIEAVQHIRRHFPDIPVIAQSAYTQPEELEEAIQAGCTDYLQKPITRLKLFEMMGRYL